MRNFLEPWVRITIEAEEITGAGDSVFAAVVQRGTGHGSGAATELRYFHVWTFRGGKVIRLETFRDRAEAREAVGLTPESA
jgi:ketosteroid isomerase-like protein